MIMLILLIALTLGVATGILVAVISGLRELYRDYGPRRK
jgi:hypothetical protein